MKISLQGTAQITILSGIWKEYHARILCNSTFMKM
jgi:hypothetical protein